MHKLVEFSGGSSIIIGIFLSLFGAGLLNLVGFSLLIIDPLLIVVLRFYHLHSLRDRLTNFAGAAVVTLLVVAYFVMPKPGCVAYNFCIPVVTISEISVYSVAAIAVVSLVVITVMFVVMDFLKVIRTRQFD